MSIRTFLLVFAGGAAGSVLRWWTGVALGHRYQGRFPLATFLINVSGAFLIGALSTLFSIEWYHRHESDLAAVIITGFLGGYTTFSSFSLISFVAARHGALADLWLNIGLSHILCLISVWVGAIVAAPFPHASRALLRALRK